MSDPSAEAVLGLLTSLRLGDGQFPSGAFAFSGGLETLCADGHFARGDLGAFLMGQLTGRWLPFDRAFVEAAAAAHDDADRLAELDETVDALTVGDLQRRSSQRAGRALLGVHARLGTAGAADYRTRVERDGLPGHQPIVQGAMLAASGLAISQVAACAAYGVLSSLCSAAVRLGKVSHLDAQAALVAVHPALAAALARPAPPLDEAAAFSPLTEIAMMRHDARPSRLFSN
ncbi:urease accessory UreF family protein [Acuticoccus mangrovi]|uniref:Urease accessory protein UreF n=1 Tax=Acuticoccus mangrovi TaxID=2796142 RepID=A0A934ISU0_9HYPH|nr:urease accessory protein UreF [Acuticoccus mangrovi]